jgi:hypothetical protein
MPGRLGSGELWSRSEGLVATGGPESRKNFASGKFENRRTSDRLVLVVESKFRSSPNNQAITMVVGYPGVERKWTRPDDISVSCYDLVRRFEDYWDMMRTAFIRKVRTTYSALRPLGIESDGCYANTTTFRNANGVPEVWYFELRATNESSLNFTPRDQHHVLQYFRDHEGELADSMQKFSVYQGEPCRYTEWVKLVHEEVCEGNIYWWRWQCFWAVYA